MVDYTFYANDYMGSAIPETAFSGMAAQAQAHLDKFKRSCQSVQGGENAEGLAVCAMAEELWRRRNSTMASATVGGVSVHYDPDKRALLRALYEKASIYLDFFRGVS